ncbi:MAG: hypothetical protein AAGG44_18145, partial [Planctomycetota bacterium]
MMFSLRFAPSRAGLVPFVCAALAASCVCFLTFERGFAQDTTPPNALGSKQASPADKTSDKPVDTPVREISELHKELRRLEKGTAKAKNDTERAQNITELCQLFVEVGQHPDIAKSPTIQSLSVRLRTRLRGIERRTSDELRRRGIPEPEEYIALRREERANRSRAAGGSRANSVAFQRNHPSRERPGATNQSANAANSTAAGEAGTKKQSTDSASVAASSRGDATKNSTGNSSGQSTAGEGNMRGNDAGGGSGNAAPGPDYSWQLVNLIHMTIQPDYWSVAGGPGKAIYFGNARALVIHGSWRVQEDVADLLTALRGG